MDYCVYMHVNKVNEKKYCGITNNVERRWRKEGIEYKPGSTDNASPFWNAICKYGWDGFEHIIVEEGLTFEQACEKEKHLIKTLELRKKKNGYNVAEGGNGGLIYLEHPRGMKGKKHSEENVIAMRERAKKNNPMKNIKWGVDKPHPKGFKGKKQSDYQKQRAKEVHTGKKMSDETKAKIGAFHKGKVVSEETRRKLSEAQKGKRAGADNTFSKKVKATLNGVETVYVTTTEAMEKLGISTTLFYRLVKSNEPYVAKGVFKSKYAHLNGLKLEYL